MRSFSRHAQFINERTPAFPVPRLFVCSTLACSLLALPSLWAVQDSYSPAGLSVSAQMGDGIALFLPAGLSLEKTPPSFCLLTSPRTEGPISQNWRLRPVFSQSQTHSRMRMEVPTGTSLYGTGEVTGPLLRNGKSVTLWNTDNVKYLADGGRRLYQSHPWVLGVRPDGTAFGVIADSTWSAELSLKDGIEFISAGPLFPVIVIDRNSPQSVLQCLAELTGKMELPPRWVLGYQQCRWSYHPDSRVREIATEFRARKIPCDVIWMDFHYMDGYRVFTFNPAEFAQPKGLNDYLHALEFKSVWMIDPGVKAEPGYRVYDSGTAADVWVHDAQGADYRGPVWPGTCVFPDFTRPETRAWWSDQYRTFMAQGIDGVWNDMNEPSVFHVPGSTMPKDNWHRGGGGLPAGPHAEYHNVYGMQMARATRDGIAKANPDKRPFVLTRANFLGGQRYAATWTGDNDSTWEYLKMAIPMSLNLGLSGQPFNGPDLGGFSGIATPELWGHWVAMGAFFPFCRGHASQAAPNKEPWAFGREVESAARTALERRYRLLPYYYTLFHESSIDGQPVMRPAFFADLHDPQLRAEDRIFLVGDDLLVVPKWAPKGIWRLISLVGERSETDTYQADLKIRGGAIIPLGRVVQSTVENSLDPLTLLVCLDRQGRATGQLYEDQGEGYQYRSGDYLLTTYAAEQRDGGVVVRVAGASGSHPRPARSIVIEVITAEGVHRATGLDGVPIFVPLQ
jgi:alpha-glucosidase